MGGEPGTMPPMASPDIEQQFKDIVAAAAAVLKAAGFKKSGTTFRLFADANCAIVSFQRSHASSDAQLIFTLNTGVVSGRLFEANKLFETDKFEAAKESDCHLRQRIGFYLMDGQDKWWTLDRSSLSEPVASVVSAALGNLVVPYLRSHITDDALIAVWESGEGLGLTEKQRLRNLAELKAAIS